MPNALQIGYGSPYKPLTPNELERRRQNAMKEALIQQQMNAMQDAPLEQPWLDPVDTLTGGLMAIPRGAVNVMADMGIDAALGMGLEGYFGGDAENAMFAGKRGMKKLGINPERDLVGQFSGLWDRQPRVELDDSLSGINMDNFNKASFGGSTDIDTQLLPDVYNSQAYKAYDDLSKVKPSIIQSDVAMDSSIGGQWRPEQNTLVAVGRNTPDVNKTVAHEVQHPIQREEGWAVGGSPDTVKDKRVDDLMYRYRLALIDNDKEKARSLISQMDDVRFDAYRRLAGEWEARNAGTRATLPSDDPRLGNALQFEGVKLRSGKPFDTADDIALDDMIVRMDGGEAKSVGKLYRGGTRDFLKRLVVMSILLQTRVMQDCTGKLQNIIQKLKILW